MKHPSSPGTIGAPVFGFSDEAETFRMPHITTTQNNAGEKIAKTEINGQVYEARHPTDASRAAEALGQAVAKLHREGKLASGVI